MGDVIKLKKFAEVDGNEAQTKIMLQKLEKMRSLCEIKTCRREFLLNYFGEKADKYCGSCDVCLNKPDLKDYDPIFKAEILRLANLLLRRAGT